MSRQPAVPDRLAEIRGQAAMRLTGGAGGQRTMVYAADALAVLYQLASSQATADDALALLHELQVHQVELDLQAEELRESRAELESALRQQIERHDLLPVGSFTIDRGGMLQELNLTGAAMLGIERDKGAGMLLEDFLDPGSRSALRKLIADLDDGHDVASSTLRLAAAGGAARGVSVNARRDSTGPFFLVVLAPMDSSCDRPTPAGDSH